MKIKILFLCAAALISCKKKPGEPPLPANPFDKQALLINMADNITLPNYASFKVTLDSLTTSYNKFKNSNSLGDFQQTKQWLLEANLKYQKIDLFEFGPAENVIVRMNFNVFPTDTPQIKSNISAGTYNLDAAANLDAKGFPALDFLFYGRNASEASIHQLFVVSAARRQYVSDLLTNMHAKISSVISQWSTYRNTFVNSLGTDVGSSIGFLVNQINFTLDHLKNEKMGIPLGKKTLGVPAPDKCEAYYSEKSVQFAYETLLQIEDAYLGRSTAGNNGIGFDDYLMHLDLKHNNNTLFNAIENQFTQAKTKLAAIPSPLSTQVVSNASQVDAAYVELVKLLVLLKTDMPSGLGVIITYQDGDGD
jgi:uncharacterized protein